MDIYNLVYFAMDKLSDGNSTSYEKTPGTAARKTKKTKDPSTQNIDGQSSILDNNNKKIACIVKSMEVLAFAHLVGQQEALEQKNLILK